MSATRQRPWTEWADLVYTSPRATVSHVRAWGTYHALCGKEPTHTPTEWYGTGSWDERAHAHDLPLCQRCDRYLARRSAL